MFQRIMDTMLEDIDGARAIMDDIIVAAKTSREHDQIMKAVITKTTNWNLKLNFEKCHIKQSQVNYVGHLVTKQGPKPDPDKVRAVLEVPTPESKEDTRRFLGFVQYLLRFLPSMSSVDSPLRELTRKDVEFHWDKPQEQSFQKLKEMCCSAPVLTYYDVHKELTIQCDASSYAVGGALLQEGRPVAYTSRALTDTESKYAQIEKEMLPIVHCGKMFHHYIFGKSVKVETDHKPLQVIFSKPLLSAPMRLQTMMLRLQLYDLEVKYKPGKEIPLGDTLSRANLPEAEPDVEPIMVNMIEKQFQQRTANQLNDLHTKRMA